MANSFFSFKQFTIHQDRCAMKVTTDACLFGAWIAEQLESSTENYTSCLDIGAGTGLLSLQLAQKLANYSFTAVEIDEDAAAQALDNFQNSPWKNRINIVQADVREISLTNKVDVIFSNPPFYEDDLRSPNVNKNRAHHDESLLLTEVIDIINHHLQPNGRFFLLLPYKRKSEIERHLTDNELHIEKLVLVKPSPENDYFRIMIKGTHKSVNTGETISQTMEVTDTEGNYTHFFTSLLKDYYLYL
ncbi:MAG: tRNA1(Val) (adenine(37)-N6)-methyltransferase [Chitinophagaceae bacterium]|jgi:tRNA1Val (adenine37-N6)-methyltransferase